MANKTAMLAVPLLFGPGDPLLAIGLLHPDLAEHKASQRIGAVILKALQEQFGDKMTEAERRSRRLEIDCDYVCQSQTSRNRIRRLAHRLEKDRD